MPRLKKFKPEWQEQREQELRSRYGGAMTAKEVGYEVGLKDYKAQMRYLEGLPRNSVKRYDTADIAKRMYEERFLA